MATETEITTQAVDQQIREADAKLPAASSSIERSRIVADCGVVSALLVANAVDAVLDRVIELEAEVAALKSKKKNKGHGKSKK